MTVNTNKHNNYATIKFKMSYTVIVIVMRVKTVIWNILVLWWMMKRSPIFMRNKKIGTS